MPSTVDTPQILDSDHLSARTRDIFAARMTAEAPQTLSARAFTVLNALLPVLLPLDEIVPEGMDISLAAQIDRALAGARDGWRFAELPTDKEAWEAALLTLDDVARDRYSTSLPDCSEDRIGTVLDDMAAGSLGLNTKERLSSAQMQRWYGDLRAEAVGCALGDPRVQQVLGISASLTGGDADVQGFTAVGPDSRESFEPVATAPILKRETMNAGEAR